jgi:hypothetical protein
MTIVEDQLNQLIKDIEYLKDRQAILDVVMRHARGHDRHDVGLMNSCFWEDGFDEHGSMVTAGPAYGDTANMWHSGGFFLHSHNITNHSCEIDGDHAHCESYVIGTMLPRQTPGRAKFTAGRYIDRMEKRNGEWRILVRRTVIDEELEGESTWPQGDLPASFPKGTWGTDDLSYARPLLIDTSAVRWNGTTS